MTTPGGPSGGPDKNGILLEADTKQEAREKTQTLPGFLQANWKRFVKNTSSKYLDFRVERARHGGFMFRATKPGNVPGSRAVYFKTLDAFGETTDVFKITYDNHGNFVHKKDKM